ncbi:hypothetical protein K3495_g11581 [Podosphaera aphanis]|nr:hypothetical protein K3495_g11581 [Podosphaera aphanis]
MLSLHHEPAEYQSNPTYEYTSQYRLEADFGLEKSLEEQLLALQQTFLASSPEAHSANLTIWQIASSSERRTWSTWIKQWEIMNPEWTHKLLVSTPKDLLSVFESIPDIRDAVKEYPSIRKDLIRHLLLWYYGGIYTSIDTWSRIPLSHCAPIAKCMKEKLSISLMIGVEIDEPFLTQNTLRKWGWSRNYGFSQDVIWAPRRFDPMLRKAIVRSISHVRTQEAARRIKILGADIGRETLEEISGAAMFTDIVLEILDQKLRYDDHLRDMEAGVGRKVNWKKFNKLKSPVWIQQEDPTSESTNLGLAIVPINVWANGQLHSHAGHEYHDDACVNQLRVTTGQGWWWGTTFE